jgi:CRP/FNR family transcriptional regulator, dissimilatory nitrate respiration regulator
MFIPGNVSLFEGISPADVQKLLSCLSYTHRSVKKGEVVVSEGDAVNAIGIVLSGGVQIIRNEYSGNRSILAEFGGSSIFAETFVCAEVARFPVSVIACSDSEILFLPYRSMIRTCASACSFHNKLIENLLSLVARKNLMLNAKMEILAKRSIREKVLEYLSSERRKAGVDSFEIPFSRNELADYLCVNRSALSRELGKMQDEAIIAMEGNVFSLSINGEC